MPTFLHTRFRVTNLATSISFYEKLGFRCVDKRDKSPQGNELAFLQIPESDYFLELAYSPNTKATCPEDLVHIAIGYKDIVAKCEELEKIGIEIWPDNWRETFKNKKMAFVTDPDGYEVELLKKESVGHDKNTQAKRNIVGPFSTAKDMDRYLDTL